MGTGCFKRLGNNEEKGLLSTQRTVADFIRDNAGRRWNPVIPAD